MNFFQSIFHCFKPLNYEMLYTTRSFIFSAYLSSHAVEILKERKKNQHFQSKFLTLKHFSRSRISLEMIVTVAQQNFDKWKGKLWKTRKFFTWCRLVEWSLNWKISGKMRKNIFQNNSGSSTKREREKSIKKVDSIGIMSWHSCIQQKVSFLYYFPTTVIPFDIRRFTNIFNTSWKRKRKNAFTNHDQMGWCWEFNEALLRSFKVDSLPKPKIRSLLNA